MVPTARNPGTSFCMKSSMWLTGGKLPTPVTEWQVVGTALARSRRNRIAHAGENHFLVLYVAARSGKAWRRDGHNQVDIGAVVVLKNGRDVDHFPLRIRPHNFQVLSFFEATGFESVDQAIHALVDY